MHTLHFFFSNGLEQFKLTQFECKSHIITLKIVWNNKHDVNMKKKKERRNKKQFERD